LDCVQKVRNPEVQYKAIYFYLTMHPLSTVRLLQVLTPNLDHARTVHLLRKNQALSLCLEYMKSVQKENLTVVNEAINEILILEEDYEGLRASIDDHDNFDQIHLAQMIERHELLEFRRISAYLYKRNKRWQQSVALSKADRMYKDAINTSAESNDQDLAEELLRFFVSVKDRASFSATLYTCYDLIRPDVVMELAWRYGYNDAAKPYMIQYVRHLHDRVHVLETRTAPPKEEEAAANDNPYANPLMLGTGMLMIGDAPAYGSYGGNSGGYNAGGIPDPYAQPNYGGYNGGGNSYGGYGGGGYY